MTSFFRSMFFGGCFRRPVVVAPAFLAILLVWMPFTALGQTTTGRILGSVHDSQDEAVGGAQVTVTDTQRNSVRTTVTDEGGDYVVPDLQPSTYKVLIEAKGFNSFQAPSILIEVGKDVRVDATLKTGDSTTVITVDEAAPMLDTTSYSLGGTLSNSEINDLPLNGRNYENLLQLRPGVVRYPGGGFSTTSSNGLRAEDNAYLVDGLFNSEPFSGQSIINGAGIAGDSATILPVDAIQEFNVIQNPPAEYGWKPGTMVNVGLKSGTNSLHGTAYGFGRTTALDARNYFNPVGTEKAPRNLKQFGATAGGPIVKDKLFFFGAYEGQRYTVGNVSQIGAPSYGWSTHSGGQYRRTRTKLRFHRCCRGRLREQHRERDSGYPSCARRFPGGYESKRCHCQSGQSSDCGLHVGPADHLQWQGHPSQRWQQPGGQHRGEL